MKTKITQPAYIVSYTNPRNLHLTYKRFGSLKEATSFQEKLNKEDIYSYLSSPYNRFTPLGKI